MDVTADTFDVEVIERSKEVPVAVYFWAEWFGPCHVLGPTVESEAAKREGKLGFAKVDFDSEQALAAEHRIQHIPTVVLFVDGVLVTGFMGLQPATFVAKFFDDVIAAHGQGVRAPD
jgi:putative thioredoxin